jgi:myosin heavy subunit
MHRVATFAAALVVACVVAERADATYLRARSQMERVKTLVEEVSEHQGRRRNDKQEDRLRNEARYYRSLYELYDACKTTVSELSGFAESVGPGASGENEARLREPNKLAGQLAYQLERELMPKVEELRALLNSDPSRRDGSFESKIDEVATTVVVAGRARVRSFEELSRKCDETQRWLQESLKAATALRDDVVRPGAELNKSKQQLERDVTQNLNELRRAYETVRDLESRHADASSRCRDAVAAHDAARMASPGSSSYLSNAKSAYERWVAAESVQKEAARNLYEGYLSLERIVAEGKTRLVELARAMRDVERYGGQADPEKVVRRYNDFTLWSRLFDYEMNR